MENEWEKISIREEEEEVRNEGLRKGQWTPEEDSKLSSYVAIHGHRNWNFLARLSGVLLFYLLPPCMQPLLYARTCIATSGLICDEL